jgi:hypothetical protein
MVKLDVGERTLTLSVRHSRKAAGGLPAAARRSRVLAERGRGRDGTAEATDSLLADVVVAGIYGTGHGDASLDRATIS